MAYAEASDVISRWGVNPAEVSAEDTALINARLADVELLIRQRIPDLDDRVTSGDISTGVVVLVESNAVLRVVRNPEGHAQESDGNYSYMVANDVASGKLEITSDEWSLLGVRSGVTVIAPYLSSPVAQVPFHSGG